eukprot:6214423-Pleurochrysis_carterae.AAC.2
MSKCGGTIALFRGWRCGLTKRRPRASSTGVPPGCTTDEAPVQGRRASDETADPGPAREMGRSGV